LFVKFANFYVDDRDNLKDIMEQLVDLPDDEKRIKEELFKLLWFFIMTFDHRVDKVKTIITKNKDKMILVVKEFMEQGLEEEEQRMMEGLVFKLENLSG
jgi:hypothetical protein